jgi:hypothetical protein
MKESEKNRTTTLASVNDTRDFGNELTYSECERMFTQQTYAMIFILKK